MLFVSVYAAWRRKQVMAQSGAILRAGGGAGSGDACCGSRICQRGRRCGRRRDRRRLLRRQLLLVEIVSDVFCCVELLLVLLNHLAIVNLVQRRQRRRFDCIRNGNVRRRPVLVMDLMLRRNGCRRKEATCCRRILHLLHLALEEQRLGTVQLACVHFCQISRPNFFVVGRRGNI